MLLTPASQPPPANLPGLERVKSATALKDTSSHNIPDLASLRISDVAKKEVQEEAKTQSGTDFLDRLSVPTVVLDTPAISHTMAAALSLSLLGHTLFLKNQVPFPVAQLARMPGGGSNPKVAKKREDLLATFDMLSSHLQTTFVALSTAYAKCKLAKGKAAAQAGDENSQKDTQAYTAGPSVGAARARILLTIDGLDVKVWGERADAPRQAQPSADSEPEDDTSIDLECTDEEDEEDTDEDSSDQEEEGSEDEDEDSSEEGSSVDASEANTSDQEDELDELESESEHASIPPASRSPSLSPPPRSLAPSPESLASPRPGPSVLPSTCAPSSPSTPSSVLVTQSVPSQSTPHFQSQSPPSTQPSTAALSYAQEQAALRAAERLLSRTLMNAWADGGGDMASELAPTQTHVYLRAPRRFAHPAWLARQNLTRSLDAVLDAFLVEAGAVGLPDGKAGAKKSRGVRTEGAWIGCRGGSAFAAAAAERASSDGHPGVDVDAEDGNEEDEEIWWAWDGKIVGFADW
ncbi:hypothetical protein ONZ51_g6895 [Trametes cubensis]|uniref:Uncharacterized protein n=1 Tax=Trametes cubensis TaxID=1111947 RepID=A0AAD7X9N9_9APHY|nr:hypothetical protein ONZ51_g6895 [Trametes cubensis]